MDIKVKGKQIKYPDKSVRVIISKARQMGITKNVYLNIVKFRNRIGG